MIDGVTILASKVIEIPAPWTDMLAYLTLGFIIIGAILFFIGASCNFESVGFLGMAMIIACAPLCLIGIVMSNTFTIPAYIQYEVTIDDSVSMNKFTEKYEVLEQRGQIYVVKEIEVE